MDYNAQGVKLLFHLFTIQMRQQVTNSIIILPLILIMSFTCISCKNNNEHNHYGNHEVIEKTILSDTTLKNIPIEDVFLEGTESVYMFISMVLVKNKDSKICDDMINKSLNINIVVRDSLIKSCSIYIMDVNQEGTLMSYVKGYEDLENILVNENVKSIDFIENYNKGFYDFRIDVNKLCYQISKIQK